jgi:hypothetical protein
MTAGSLVLLERKHELAMTPLEGCVSDDQCNSLAQVAARIDASADPFTARTHWSCQNDPLRAPVNSDPAKDKRCMQVCSTDPTDASYPYDCANGTVCRALNPNSPTDHRGVCLEGVEPPQSCLNGPQRAANQKLARRRLARGIGDDEAGNDEEDFDAHPAEPDERRRGLELQVGGDVVLEARSNPGRRPGP